MADNHDDDVSDELKALIGVYSLLAYLARELACLEQPCEDAEDAVAAAQAAIRARMSKVESEAEHASATENGEAVIH